MDEPQFEEARSGQCDWKAAGNKDRVRLLARIVAAAHVEDAGRAPGTGYLGSANGISIETYATAESQRAPF